MKEVILQVIEKLQADLEDVKKKQEETVIILFQSTQVKRGMLLEMNHLADVIFLLQEKLEETQSKKEIIKHYEATTQEDLLVAINVKLDLLLIELSSIRDMVHKLGFLEKEAQI